MVDKVFGLDFADDANPAGTWTLSINNGTVLKDVTLAQVLKILAGLTLDGTPASGDSMLTWDTSASDVKQVLLSNLHKALTIATDTQSGAIELATSAETLTGTDATRAVTPSTLHDILTRIPRSGMMLNGRISPTVTTNNLSLALKTLANVDPSASDPVYVNINGIVRTITAALSVTVNAGAASGSGTFNAGAVEFATLPIDYFAYLAWRAASSAVVIGFGRFSYARVYSDFSGTAANEKYGAFSTAPASTDDVCVIGRFEATNSGTASYNWSVPTFTNVNLIQEPIFDTRILSWVPVWTNLTITSATVTAEYQLRGKKVDYEVVVVWGASTAISGNVSHSLPFTKRAHGGTNNTIITGIIRMWDNSATTAYQGLTQMFSPYTAANYIIQNASATYLTSQQISSTVPMTWATSDEMQEKADYWMA